jgi:hypothetical protein
MKLHSTYRISEEGKELMKLLTQDLGVNQTSVLEIAIRELAVKRGVRPKAELVTIAGKATP